MRRISGRIWKRKSSKGLKEALTINPAFPESISNSRDGDVGMSESEKLITESQNELKYGQPERALALVNRFLFELITNQNKSERCWCRGLSVLTDLDALTFVSQAGKNHCSEMVKYFFLLGLSLDQLERLGFLTKSNSLQMMGKLEVIFLRV